MSKDMKVSHDPIQLRFTLADMRRKRMHMSFQSSGTAREVCMWLDGWIESIEQHLEEQEAVKR